MRSKGHIDQAGTRRLYETTESRLILIGSTLLCIFLSAMFMIPVVSGGIRLDYPLINGSTTNSLTICMVATRKDSVFHEVMMTLFSLNVSIYDAPSNSFVVHLFIHADPKQKINAATLKLFDWLTSRVSFAVYRHYIGPDFYGDLIGLKTPDQYHIANYARLFFPDRFPEGWILYLDADVIALRPFLEPLHQLIARLSPKILVVGAQDAAIQLRPRMMSGFRKKHTGGTWNWSNYINSGVLLMRNGPALRREFAMVRQRLGKKKPYWHYVDQAALNLWIDWSKKFVVDQRWNWLEEYSIVPCKRPYFFHGHLTKTRKFWNKLFAQAVKGAQL